MDDRHHTPHRLQQKPSWKSSSNRDISGNQFTPRPRFILPGNVTRASDAVEANQRGGHVDSDDLIIEDDFLAQKLSRETVAPHRGRHDSDDLVIEDFPTPTSSDKIFYSDVGMSSELDDFSNVPRNPKRRQISVDLPESKSDHPSHEIANNEHPEAVSFLSSPDFRDGSPVLAPSLMHLESKHQSIIADVHTPMHSKLIPGTPHTIAQEKNIGSDDRASSAFYSRRQYISEFTSPTARAPASVPYQGRKKPMFVLSGSPSPDQENRSSFSRPSKSFLLAATSSIHGKRQLGSSETGLSDPLGDLSRQFKDWTLERQNTSGSGWRVASDISKYTLTVKINTCSNAVPRNWDSVEIVRATEIVMGQQESHQALQVTDLRDDFEHRERNIILLSPDTTNRYQPVNRSITTTLHQENGTSIKSALNPGDMVRIYMDQTWEVPVPIIYKSDDNHTHEGSDQKVIPGSQSPSENMYDNEAEEEHGCELQTTNEMWLVAAKWEVVHKANL